MKRKQQAQNRKSDTLSSKFLHWDCYECCLGAEANWRGIKDQLIWESVPPNYLYQLLIHIDPIDVTLASYGLKCVKK